MTDHIWYNIPKNLQKGLIELLTLQMLKMQPDSASGVSQRISQATQIWSHNQVSSSSIKRLIQRDLTYNVQLIDGKYVLTEGGREVLQDALFEVSKFAGLAMTSNTSIIGLQRLAMRPCELASKTKQLENQYNSNKTSQNEEEWTNHENTAYVPFEIAEKIQIQYALAIGALPVISGSVFEANAIAIQANAELKKAKEENERLCQLMKLPEQCCFCNGDVMTCGGDIEQARKKQCNKAISGVIVAPAEVS